MLRKKNSIATRTTADQPKARIVHYYCHSLGFTAKQLTSPCEVLGNQVGTVCDIFAFVSF